ncbi:MAG: hypothetical protein WAW46_07515, partial [Polaromonas sp.]
MENTIDHEQHGPWNKGVIVGQKSPLKLKEIWAIRVRLQLQHRVRELAMFDLGLDSNPRGDDQAQVPNPVGAFGQMGGADAWHPGRGSRCW